MSEAAISVARQIRPVAAACIFTALAAPAAAAAEPFAGKTITIYVGSGAGGVYDVFGRLVQRHIVRHIPGEPNVVVSPMPGAGGITTSNFIYNVAPRDGSALGIVSAALKVMETIPGARYEAQKFNWVGRILSTSNVTFTRGPGRVATLEEARQRESKIGATAIGNALSFYTRALNITGGTKFEMIHGYVDAAAGMLALERGEVDGVTFSWNSLKNMRPQWLADKSANILVQYAPTRHSQLADIPTAIEVSRTPEDKALMAVFMASAETGISIKAPPGVPFQNIETLRRGFAAMIKDPAFRDDAAKLESDFDPLDGWELQKIVEASGRASPAIMERVRAIVNAQ